ncbi:hypothetical protein Pst134EA_021267 [Puccinia striiformis f. sp. tritici]|uniref:hypothetical protein n=1 Tax=Puccinia striiformis f. sp. tritici TaxID=168172 RepID=UPI0020086D55|nr:hypothetical protein Pst134EA_021267 [Puccinia striiformis f. sp. tritici]KAH9457389.1 hypothetical protein Pst134EA_021267 [Puccinia striiformis f. sp. tritici]
MANDEDQSTAPAVPSTEQQISELRGSMLEMKSSLTDLFSQIRLHFAPQHDPPPHQAQPQQNPHPTFPTFHAQFSPAPPHPNSFSNRPPPPQPFPTDNPPTGQDIPLSRYEEPRKLADIWFSGEPRHLESFLKEMRNFLHPRSMYFASDSRVIVWVSLHFGFRPSEHRQDNSRSQNWYLSLIQRNARLQNKLTPYADLERLPFVLPVLSSWEAFQHGLIEFFGDKFQIDSIMAALDACKQGSLSVVDYNTQFSSLAYLIDLTDKDRLNRYTSGLNTNVLNRVQGPAWRALKTLEEKMECAMEGAKDLELMAKASNPSLKPKLNYPPPPSLYQHPHSAQRAPDAMDVDATTFYSNRRPLTPFEILFKRVCLAQRCCFRCLKRTNPPDHSSPSNCPNGRTTLEEKQRFVERYQSAPPVPVAMTTFDSEPLPPVVPTVPTVPSPPVPTPNPSIQGFDEVYDEFIESHLATVAVRLDTSRTGRIMVPVSFQVSPSRSVVASVLVDTGAMANFVNKKFIDDNQLPTRLRKTPIRCIGFDGNEGVGGTVTHDWAGRIHVSSADSTATIPFSSSFGVTCLGTVDAIFGMPWLDRQSWQASGSSADGHRFTLGSTDVFVVDACSLGEELEG